ncbi:hypothetical protein [uncultured Aquimarina sp.]|uniref:hypothetical protein n=1 Tax=uncultured Aquimarina sp. TaxID=575652 RepID=UPI0026260CDE|nr:hypothetical protein [uncultured Aquimarina sp.]
MKIKHHIGGNWSHNQVSIFDTLGLSIKEGIDTIEIEEGEIYLKLKPYLEEWGVLDMRYPEFTKKELKESLLSAKNGGHIHGYPMPDLDGSYLELTYDLSNYSKSSGIGKKQKDAFRLKNVPKVGKKRMFGVGWIFDEYFVDTELYNEVFKPLGIKSREILEYKKEKPFDTHVQLVLEETEETLSLKNNPIEKCEESGRWKYQPMQQGFYPQYKNIIAPIFKSKEWFGTGAEARKRIFVTQELREKLIEMKIEKPQWYIPTK